MALVTRDVQITVVCRTTFDEAKFTPEFQAEFNSTFYDYGDDLGEHLKHLAWLHVRREMQESDFIEGYGVAKDMGVSFKILDPDDIELLSIDERRV